MNIPNFAAKIGFKFLQYLCLTTNERYNRSSLLTSRWFPRRRRRRRGRQSFATFPEIFFRKLCRNGFWSRCREKNLSIPPTFGNHLPQNPNCQNYVKFSRILLSKLPICIDRGRRPIFVRINLFDFFLFSIFICVHIFCRSL